MSGVVIKYGDIAIGAKESFSASVSEKTDFSNISQLEKNGIVFPNYGNPCELYSVLLDGVAVAFPSNTENKNIGWWSEQVSNEHGSFETPVVLTLTATQKYTSSSITFTFDEYNNIFPNKLNIEWYRDDELLSSKDFYPDNAFYSCENKIEFYDKVVVTFYSLNMPYNRLKLRAIEYGYQVSFNGDELKKVKLIQEIDPISSEIAINTADFTLSLKQDKEYSFQTRQMLSIYFDEQLNATEFIKSAKRRSKTVWDIQCEDYIGLLDGIYYYGGMYKRENAYDLLTNIFLVAKIPCSIDLALKEITVTGYIPYTTCREAIMHVLVATGAVADTSNSDVVKIYFLSNETMQVIPLSRIMQGQNFEDETRVTVVEVVSHEYIETAEESTIYEADKSGTGENIFIKFSEPLHDLLITNGSIVSQGTNFAVINALAGCVLTGQKYQHIETIKSKKNNLVLQTDTENTASIQNATLVSPDNVDKVLERCYNYLVNRRNVNLRIVEGKHETTSRTTYDPKTVVGDVIETETEYSGNLTGRIVKQTFNLNGGIVIKETVMR